METLTISVHPKSGFIFADKASELYYEKEMELENSIYHLPLWNRLNGEESGQIGVVKYLIDIEGLECELLVKYDLNTTTQEFLAGIQNGIIDLEKMVENELEEAQSIKSTEASLFSWSRL